MFAEPADSSTIGVEGYTAFKDWYLAKHPSIKPSIVWANDLENRRYEKTAGTLLKESKEVGNLDVKHVRIILFGGYVATVLTRVGCRCSSC